MSQHNPLDPGRYVDGTNVQVGALLSTLIGGWVLEVTFGIIDLWTLVVSGIGSGLIGIGDWIASLLDTWAAGPSRAARTAIEANVQFLQLFGPAAWPLAVAELMLLLVLAQWAVNQYV